MKIQLWAVGKHNDKLFDDAVKHYTHRIGFYFPVEWKLFPASNSTQKELAMKAEAEAFNKTRQKGDVLVALDKGGKQLTSPELAAFIEHQSFNSTKNLTIIIGGSWGIDPGFMKSCNHLISFSKLTFPHQLARVILTEQIYRACTILRHEGYHH